MGDPEYERDPLDDDRDDDEPTETDNPMVISVNIEESDDETKEIIKRKKGVVYPRRQKPLYMKRDFRSVTKQTCIELLKNEKNADIFEKHVYNAAVRLAKKKGVIATSHLFLRIYTDLIFNLCVKVTPKVIKKYIELLKTDQVEWKDPVFDEFNILRKMEESVGSNETVEIEDGMYTCRHCGSVKTRQIQIQIRSADEGMTNFIICANRKCRKMWKQNN
jgi:DNA-directed RNA polymerase subunit M/transcription elongation factor TFIIS